MDRNSQFPNTLWTRVLLNRQLSVVGVDNFDDKFFFGKQLVVGKTIMEVVGEENSLQLRVVIAGLEKAFLQRRNTCFVYQSTYLVAENTHVSVHVEYISDYSLCLYLTKLYNEDMVAAQHSFESNTNIMMHTIYEQLPVGVEIFDKDGLLIDANTRGVLEAGVKSKDDVLGICLFDNPLLSDDIKNRLRAGEDMSFNMDYDHGKLGGYLNTMLKGVCHYEILVTIIRDEKGNVDKYIVIAQNVTDCVELQNRYRDLYSQCSTILNSLPIGAGIYSAKGDLLYVNEANCRIFGVDRQQVMDNPIALSDNSILPDHIKEAILNGTHSDCQFGYNFDRAVKDGVLNSTNTNIRQLATKGSPIMNASGVYDSYVFVVEDITDKLKGESVLVHSRLKTEMAMSVADIMLWEFDVESQLFYSDNEPLNGYDKSKPITIDVYIDTVHPDDREQIIELMRQLSTGEMMSFSYDIRVRFPNKDGWQYCSVTGSPYQRDAQGRAAKYVGARKNNTELHMRKLLQDKILDSIPLSIHIKDVEDDFRYVFCNEESSKLFGTSVNTTAYDVMDSDEIERIRKTDLEVFTSGESYFGAEHIVLKNGHSYDTIVRKSVINDNDKRLLLSIRWDQSMHNDLQRRSKLFTMTLESMNAFTWFYDPAKERINFGDGLDKVGSRSAEINTLEKYLECMHPEDVDYFVGSLKAAVEQDSGVWKAEHRFDINGDGSYMWLEARGILETMVLNDAPYKYMLGMTISIDDHKKSELILLNNKEHLKRLIRQNELILNNTSSGLAYITMDYIVQWENISICSASLSYEAYKKGEHCYKSAHNRTSPCDGCVMQRAFKSRQMEKIQFVLDNNRMVEVFATPVFIDDQTMDGIVIRVDDITERQKMIEELREAKALAEQSDKLKSAFLANMSHEIRTPLNAIIGFSELLISNPEDEDRQEYIGIINNNNELLLKLISDILDLSKIEAGSIDFKYEEFDLAAYFDGMSTSMHQRVARSNVRLVDINPYDSCIVNLDKNRVAQLMTNYVTNAIKYTPKGIIEMGYECVMDGVRLYVTDTGIGIAADKKDKVFHRFAKLDEFAQGTGLGLSICKAIAESMGGRVGFDSQFGEGSTFWAFLPCKPHTITATDSLEILDGVVSNTNVNTSGDCVGYHPEVKRTILIAEDINSNYLLLLSILKNNFILLRAQNGQQAVDIIRENQVDLVFMDMKMPIMDGLMATAEIRKFNQRVPIVALTAHAFESDRMAALKVGCSEYLVKPIDKPRLMSVLQKYCSVTFKVR